MTTESVLQALLRAPQSPTELALESARKVLDTALDGCFPYPEIQTTPLCGVKMSWATETSELAFEIAPTGRITYEFEIRQFRPFGVAHEVHRHSESGDITDPSEGTQSLLIWLLANDMAHA